jgi:hypothetical protein
LEQDFSSCVEFIYPIIDCRRLSIKKDIDFTKYG